MKITKKLEVANLIYESDLPSFEKKIYLENIKDLDETQLDVWIKSEVLSEGFITKAIGLSAAALIGVTALNVIMRKLDRCKNNCKESYKISKNKEEYKQCLQNCFDSKMREIEAAKKISAGKKFK